MYNVLADFRSEDGLYNESLFIQGHPLYHTERLSANPLYHVSHPYHFGGDPIPHENVLCTTNKNFGEGQNWWTYGNRKDIWVNYRRTSIDTLLNNGTISDDACHQETADLISQTNFGEQRYDGLLKEIKRNINDFKTRITREIKTKKAQHSIYMAWTKLKVLASISNVAFFELLTGTDIDDIDGFNDIETKSRRGGGDKEYNIYNLIHDPSVFNITKFEVFIHCFLALGDKEKC